jgi:hypothetical protein
MGSVHLHQPPFTHDLYVVSLLGSGTSRELNGQPLATNLFFNVPGQVISWDIAPDWRGWYLVFDAEFARQLPSGGIAQHEFAFLRDQAPVPFSVSEAETRELADLYSLLHTVWDAEPTSNLLPAYVDTLLLHVRRHFRAYVIE